MKKKREDNITKDVKNIFRLNKEIDDNTIESIRNIFRLKKQNEGIKDRIIRDNRNLFEPESEDYYEPVRVRNFWSRNYIECESNRDRNKTVSIIEYLYKIRPYLKDIINDLKKFDTWKIQLTIAINFISSKDTDEERVMHSKSDNIEIMINDKADEVIEELFHSLLSRYQIGLKASMKGSEFVFDYVHLSYYKWHKINPNRGGSYIDSPDWIKKQKVKINPINKKDDRHFQYAITFALNDEKIKDILKE